MYTKVCEQLGIDLPIFAFTHCRDVVAAVSQAGGLGVLGAVGFTPEQLEIECAWIDEHVGDKPYGVDIVIPGKYEGMDELDPSKLEEQLKALIPISIEPLRQSSSPITASPNCHRKKSTTNFSGGRLLRRVRKSTSPSSTTRFASSQTPSARRRTM